MFGEFDFRIHYGILNGDAIFNACGPPDAAYIDRLNQRDGFYDKLTASVAREGFRNPILVTSGRQGLPDLNPARLPPEIHPETIVCCDRNGGSRLWVANRLRLPIPCLISDWVGTFRHLEELLSREAVLAKFRDPPEGLLVNRHGLHVLNLPQVHLTPLGVPR